MKHILITRLMYRDKELLESRIQVMNEILIPCLKSQINQNFTFCIMMHSEDVGYVKNLTDYEFITFNDYKDLKLFLIKENFQIQTRHDSDDFMYDNYIETIQNECEKIEKNENIALLQFQPEKINYKTQEKLYQPLYTNEMISGFVTLYQKNVEITVYEKSHTTLCTLTSNIHTYPTGYVIYFIHGKNDSLIPIEERIEKWKYNHSTE